MTAPASSRPTCEGISWARKPTNGLRDLDLGDFLGVAGSLFRTRTGELTVDVRELTLLSKALLPPPEKWHGLEDVEIRYRQRYLDLIANPEVQEIFALRSRVVSAIRRFLDGRGFLEVETPILQPVAGGARPGPSSPTTTPSTATSTCASPRSCT